MCKRENFSWRVDADTDGTRTHIGSNHVEKKGGTPRAKEHEGVLCEESSLVDTAYIEMWMEMRLR